MKTLILGAGMTGLAAARASGLPVYEQAAAPGGICSSYYLRSGSRERLDRPPADGEAWRFEIGGGHWIFGGDPLVLDLIHRLAPVRRYARRSSVWLPERGLLVPYPLQNHLSHLGPALAGQALEEVLALSRARPPVTTMQDWLQASFGPTLCELFFEPFHRLYTAGLHERIAPQDAYKSPIDPAQVVRGAFGDRAEAAGYNQTFAYPVDGLDALSRGLAAGCQVHYGHRVTRIDPAAKTIAFANGKTEAWERLLCTLPLNHTLRLAGVEVAGRAHPSPGVLVLNLGAERGPRCPTDQWIYVRDTRGDFHRVGFYDQVDESFLPASARGRGTRTSIYVEKAYPEGGRPDAAAEQALIADVSGQLREWGWIGAVEVADPTWIEVAYTWSWPGSRWVQDGIAALEARGIHQVGRYARWCFQGIADSIKDGLLAGCAMR